MNRNKVLESFSRKFKTRRYKDDEYGKQEQQGGKDRWRQTRRQKIAEEEDAFEASIAPTKGRP